MDIESNAPLLLLTHNYVNQLSSYLFVCHNDALPLYSSQLQGAPGQTVQQVIESSIPEFSTTSYQVFLYPSKALLNPEKDARVLQDQEISIEPMRASPPGMLIH